MIFSIVDIVVTILLIGLIIYDKKRRHKDNFRDRLSLSKSESESDDYQPARYITKQPSYTRVEDNVTQQISPSDVSSTTSLPRKKDISRKRQAPLYSTRNFKNLESLTSICHVISMEGKS